MSRLILNETTAPSAPATGKQSLYVTNEALPRLRRKDGAGNEWPICETLMLAQAADYTLTDTLTAQKAFNATTNGQVTLPANSGYILEGCYSITNTGTTSHQWQILFAGTATLTSGRLTVYGVSQTSAAPGTGVSPLIGHTATLGSALTVTAASVSATENVEITFSGVVRINAGGTFIPQVKLLTSVTGGVEKMLANSYIKLTPFGTDVATALGNWS